MRFLNVSLILADSTVQYSAQCSYIISIYILTVYKPNTYNIYGVNYNIQCRLQWRNGRASCGAASPCRFQSATRAYKPTPVIKGTHRCDVIPNCSLCVQVSRGYYSRQTAVKGNIQNEGLPMVQAPSEPKNLYKGGQITQHFHFHNSASDAYN